MEETVLAWHFLAEDGRLRFEDRRQVIVGETLRADGTLVLCENGMHASLRAIDALEYAPGPIVCRVRLSGGIIAGPDKLVARERTVLAMADATPVLHEFSLQIAERGLLREQEAGRKPDPRSWAALEAKRKWLKGKITDAELDAARAAARAAAWAAAWAAARAAARAAAWDAAWDEQNALLEGLLLQLLGITNDRQEAEAG